MKATELMKSDWVYNTHNRQPEQVCEIRERMVMMAYNDLYDYDEIEPIPLNAEILKKNGFEEEHGYREIVYSYSNDFYGICIHLKERNYTNGAYTFANISHGCTFVEELQTNYVHELQHAMRMFKIEKEIEL